MTPNVDSFITRYASSGPQVLAGLLRLREPRLIAFDPTFSDGATPFAQPTPTGDFDVMLSAGRGRGEIAARFASVRFQPDAEVAVWEVGVRDGEVAAERRGEMVDREVGPLDGPTSHFTVASGLAAFGDPTATATLGALLVAEVERDRMVDPRDWFAGVVRAPRAGWPGLTPRPMITAGALSPDPQDERSVVYVGSAAGDMPCACYFGYDAHGAVSEVVADLDPGVFDPGVFDPGVLNPGVLGRLRR